MKVHFKDEMTHDACLAQYLTPSKHSRKISYSYSTRNSSVWELPDGTSSRRQKDQKILFHTTGTGLYSVHLGGTKIIFLLSGLWSELNVPTVVISSHPALINSQSSMEDIKLLAVSYSCTDPKKIYAFDKYLMGIYFVLYYEAQIQKYRLIVEKEFFCGKLNTQIYLCT